MVFLPDCCVSINQPVDRAEYLAALEVRIVGKDVAGRDEERRLGCRDQAHHQRVDADRQRRVAQVQQQSTWDGDVVKLGRFGCDEG